VANVIEGLGEIILQLMTNPSAGSGRRHFSGTSAESLTTC
jgi:hypothetical protein